MRAEQNRQRIARLQAQESLRLDMHIDATLGEHRYTTDDVTPDGQIVSSASPVMEVLRAMLIARLKGTLYHELEGNSDLIRIAELCVPRALTYDVPSLARGFYQAYAAAAMRLATTGQLGRWVTAYCNKAEGRNQVALGILARECVRGLMHLRWFYAQHGIMDMSSYARYATNDNVARREFSAFEHRAWHRLTDSTHAYVGTGKLSRRERARKHGHAARRARERAAGKPAHH